MNIDEIECLARDEIKTEDHRRAVDLAKARIRERMGRSIWDRLFPWRVVIVRK